MIVIVMSALGGEALRLLFESSAKGGRGEGGKIGKGWLGKGHNVATSWPVHRGHRDQTSRDGIALSLRFHWWVVALLLSPQG